MERRIRNDDYPPPVDFPSDDQISSRAFELFFQERDVPRPFADYRRHAETELLERAFQRVLFRACRKRRFPPRR